MEGQNMSEKVSSRAGKKFIGGYFDKEVARHIKVLSATEGSTIQDLVAEAIGLLFKERGMAAEAELVKASSAD